MKESSSIACSPAWYSSIEGLLQWLLSAPLHGPEGLGRGTPADGLEMVRNRLAGNKIKDEKVSMVTPSILLPQNQSQNQGTALALHVADLTGPFFCCHTETTAQAAFISSYINTKDTKGQMTANRRQAYNPEVEKQRDKRQPN